MAEPTWSLTSKAITLTLLLSRLFLAPMQPGNETRREREAWASLAPASRRRYRSALRKLRNWTEKHAAGAASAPDLLCNFLEAEAAAGRINGLAIVLSALTFWQRAPAPPGGRPGRS